jgi:hypothetical protein
MILSSIRGVAIGATLYRGKGGSLWLNIESTTAPPPDPHPKATSSLSEPVLLSSFPS